MMQKSRVQSRRKSVAKMVNAAFASWLVWIGLQIQGLMRYLSLWFSSSLHFPEQSWHFVHQKIRILPKKSCLPVLIPVPDAKYQLPKLGHAQNANFRCPFPPLLSPFLSQLFFFSICWAFSMLYFGGKRFWESFWDRRMKWKELQAGSGTKFSWEISGLAYMVFFFFFPGLSD